MNGKGSSPRPKSVPAEVFSSNWTQVFGQPKTKRCFHCGDSDSTVQFRLGYGTDLCDPCAAAVQLFVTDKS